MSYGYDYGKVRPEVFTEAGLATFTLIRDRSKKLLDEAGAFTLGAVIRGATGDSFVMLACVDLLVERGEIVQVANSGTVAQHRVYVSASGR